MNGYLLSASVLAFVFGLIHTILGEVLIFRRMRRFDLDGYKGETSWVGRSIGGSCTCMSYGSLS